MKRYIEREALDSGFRKEATFKRFKGLRNVVPADRFESGDLATADNLDLDDSGKLLSRNGYLRKITGAFHSLWAKEEICLFVNGTELHQLKDNLTASQIIRTGLTAGLKMSYEYDGGKVFYTNGKQTGICGAGGARSWGIVPPAYQPLAIPGFGGLSAGTYQYALTYLRNDGQESGTGIADSIIIAEGGAINFTSIPVSADPDVTFKLLYISPPNGEMLYVAMTLPNTLTTSFYNGSLLSTPLATQFKTNPPAGQALCLAAGVMYVAQGQWLYHSEPYNYDLFDLREYLPFDSEITMVARVLDGLFVGTRKKIYFVRGLDPKTSIAEFKSDYGVVPGTMTMVHMDLLDAAGKIEDELIPVWVGEQGIMAGLTGGAMINLSQKRYLIDGSAREGAGLFRTNNGINQYLATLSK